MCVYTGERLLLFPQCKHEFQSTALTAFGGDIAAMNNHGIFYDSGSKKAGIVAGSTSPHAGIGNNDADRKQDLMLLQELPDLKQFVRKDIFVFRKRVNFIHSFIDVDSDIHEIRIITEKTPSE